MAIRVLLVVAILMAFYGCGQSSPASEQGEKEDVEEAVEETPDGEKIQKEVSVPADVPAYTLTKDEKGMVAGYAARSVSATTNATTEEDLEAITRELWADTDAETLQVVFYPNEPTAESTGSGMAFASEGAARATFEAISAQGADPQAIEVDVRKAMRNDGIYVIPTEEMIDEMIEEECAKWDTTTMGTPPPEWDCPGY
jgi:hypothetical protein